MLRIKTKIDFLSKTKLTSTLSLFIIVLGIASLFLNRGPNLSIDFTGGTIIQILFNEDITTNAIRDSLDKTYLKDSEIIQFGQKNEYRIKTNTNNNSNELSSLLIESFPNKNIEITM